EGRNIRECLPRRKGRPTESRLSEDSRISRAMHSGAKADVVEEELVESTRRADGVRGAALQHREADPKRDGRDDQPWMAQAARTPPIRPQRAKRRSEESGSAHGPVVAKKEGNATGAKEPWAETVRRGTTGRNPVSGINGRTPDGRDVRQTSPQAGYARHC